MREKRIEDMSIQEAEAFLNGVERDDKEERRARVEGRGPRTATSTNVRPREQPANQFQAPAERVQRLFDAVRATEDLTLTNAQVLERFAESPDYYRDAYPAELAAITPADVAAVQEAEARLDLPRTVLPRALHDLRGTKVWEAEEKRDELAARLQQEALGAPSYEAAQAAVETEAKLFAAEHFPESFVERYERSQKSPDVSERIAGERAFNEVIGMQGKAAQRVAGNPLDELSLTELEELLNNQK